MEFENNIWKASIIIERSSALFSQCICLACVNNSPELPKIELSLSSNKILGTPNALRIFRAELSSVDWNNVSSILVSIFCIKMCSKLSDSKFASSSSTPDEFSVLNLG
jgi:hypothetical protein